MVKKRSLMIIVLQVTGLALTSFWATFILIVVNLKLINFMFDNYQITDKAIVDIGTVFGLVVVIFFVVAAVIWSIECALD
jgi:hypothetical protein